MTQRIPMTMWLVITFESKVHGCCKTCETHTIEQLDCPASTHFNIFRECFAFFQLMMTLALLPFCNEPCARPDRREPVS